MKLKATLYASLLALAAGLGLGAGNAQALPNPECDCFGQRYECFAQCYGNQQCRQACQLAYDDCRTGCFGG